MPPALENLPAAPAAKTSVAALLNGAAAPASGAGASALTAANGPTTPANTPAAASAAATPSTPGGGAIASKVEDFLRVLASAIGASANASTGVAATPTTLPAAAMAMAATQTPVAATVAGATDAAVPQTSARPATSSSSTDRTKDAPSEEVLQWLMQMLLPAPAMPLAAAQAQGAAAPGGTSVASAHPAQSGDDAELAQALQLLGAAPSTAADATHAHTTHTDPLAAASALLDPAAAVQPQDPTQSQGVPQAPALDPAVGASLAQLHAATAHLQPSAPQAAPLELRSTVGTSAWVQELGGHLTLMAHQGNEQASLHVTPPDLGPIEVRIAVHDSQASVWFGAAHTETRAALESALPRLRELFASQGLALADAGVFREPPRREQPVIATAPSRGIDQTDTATVTSVSNTRIGLIDTYV